MCGDDYRFVNLEDHSVLNVKFVSQDELCVFRSVDFAWRDDKRFTLDVQNLRNVKVQVFS